MTRTNHANQTEAKSDPDMSPRPVHTDHIIDKWFHEQIHGSPVARNTTIYNHLCKAIDDLKYRLRRQS